MDYETIDWEAEAKRVSRAFGADENCHFRECFAPHPVEDEQDSYRQLYWGNEKFGNLIDEREKLVLWCVYFEDWGLTYFLRCKTDDRDTGFTIEWEGRTYITVENVRHAPILAEGLFHLGLLTPKLEHDLGLSISAHQKMEWTREFEARYDV